MTLVGTLCVGSLWRGQLWQVCHHPSSNYVLSDPYPFSTYASQRPLLYGPDAFQDVLTLHCRTWNREVCVEPFKNGALFSHSHQLFWTEVLLVFKVRCYGGSSSWYRSLDWQPDVSFQNLHSCDISILLEGFFHGGVASDQTVLSHLSQSGLFFILLVVIKKKICLASFQVILTDNSLNIVLLCPWGGVSSVLWAILI